MGRGDFAFDISGAGTEKLGRVSGANFYAEWRVRSGLAPVLRETPQVPPERLLQAVWFHQRLQRDRLVTLDGRRVQVLHPGFWNREAGPDFHQAVLQIEPEPARSGDVEVDLHSRGWRAHHHHTNPAFRGVALHVVWEGEPKTDLPTLALKEVLDAPLGELHFWLGSEAPATFPEGLTGQCCAPLQPLGEADLQRLLREAALVRLQGKAAQFQARARHAGWDQALWEGLFRALGYKHNHWPMQRLAELRGRLTAGEPKPAPQLLQARLLGVGGLLPAELTRAEAQPYVRQLWDYWWRERDSFADCLLPRAAWRLHGLRPANHPQRRLALAAHWLARADLPRELEAWCRGPEALGKVAGDLLALLGVTADDFWSWHWTLRAGRLRAPHPLLGGARITDLAMNIVLPWLWSRVVEGKNEPLRRELERRFLEWPAGEDNAVLRLARQRLLKRGSGRGFRTAAAQQGLLQIVRDFCERTNALCADCRFPELVRELRARK
jgi:hypothetical protein